MKRTQRTDPHRPGAIIPADYEMFGFFAYGGSDGMPSYNMELLQSPAVQQGGIVHIDRASGGCQVCGKHYRFGALFKHTPTGQFIKMGHECARKYEILADFAGFDAAFAAHERANAVQVQAALNQRRFDEFCAARPGLREALAFEHRISVDLADRLRRFGSLSDPQCNLAFKLLSDAYCPAKAPDAVVPAPEGRCTVRGKVVKLEERVGDWGACWKMTVKVITPAGVWLAWGTAPGILLEQAGDAPVRGQEVEFTATFKRGRDAHFALFSRPVKASIVVNVS